MKLNLEFGRINLGLALLETQSKGGGSTYRWYSRCWRWRRRSRTSSKQLDDGLQRRPNWSSLEKVKTWLNL